MKKREERESGSTKGRLCARDEGDGVSGWDGDDGGGGGRGWLRMTLKILVVVEKTDGE